MAEKLFPWEDRPGTASCQNVPGTAAPISTHRHEMLHFKRYFSKTLWFFFKLLLIFRHLHWNYHHTGEFWSQNQREENSLCWLIVNRGTNEPYIAHQKFQLKDKQQKISFVLWYRFMLVFKQLLSFISACSY